MFFFARLFILLPFLRLDKYVFVERLYIFQDKHLLLTAASEYPAHEQHPGFQQLMHMASHLQHATAWTCTEHTVQAAADFACPVSLALHGDLSPGQSTSWSLPTRDCVGTSEGEGGNEGGLPVFLCTLVPSLFVDVSTNRCMQPSLQIPKRWNFQNKPSPTTGGAATAASPGFLLRARAEDPAGCTTHTRIGFPHVIASSMQKDNPRSDCSHCSKCRNQHLIACF